MTVLRVGIGLVAKCDGKLADEWIASAESCGDVILVVDNGIEQVFRDKLLAHPKTKKYLLQKGKERNMSRDYQKILDFAREENCDWLWLIDHDEVVPNISKQRLKAFLVNCRDTSIGLPIFELRNDDSHYIKIKDGSGEYKDARLCHKVFKVLLHYQYDIKDAHSRCIPQNCVPAECFLPIPVLHYGHMTKELREAKRNDYIKNKQLFGTDDKDELSSDWMREDEENLIIRTFESFLDMHQDFKMFEVKGNERPETN